MKRKIIFDFNRTLFDPESLSLDDQAVNVLTKLRDKGFDLYLISHGLEGERLIEELGIKNFFKKAVFVEEKNKEVFKDLVGENVRNVIIVGDRVGHEIKIGNLLGFKTVWLKKGRFATELPAEKVEEPDFVIEKLEELLSLEL